MKTLSKAWLILPFFALTPDLGAQGVGEPETLPKLLQKLRNPRLDRYARDDVVARVLAHGEKGATALYSFARADYKRRYQAFRKSMEHHLKAFEIGAKKVLLARQDKVTQARVAELRAKARQLSSQSGLTKQTIQAELDPIDAELGKILTVSVADVMQAQPKLQQAATELQAKLDALYDNWDFVDRAAGELRATKKGERFVERQKPLSSADGHDKELTRTREWLAILARPMSERDQKLLLRNKELASELDPEEYDGILTLNLLRIRLGRSVLAIDVKLCNASRDHSKDMRTKGFFSHTSPIPGKETPSKRAALAGTSGGAENIARGAATGKGSIRQWWYSPGHHRNMMRNAGRIGLGRSGRHWTQMFGG